VPNHGRIYRERKRVKLYNFEPDEKASQRKGLNPDQDGGGQERPSRKGGAWEAKGKIERRVKCKTDHRRHCHATGKRKEQNSREGGGIKDGKTEE